ncbi:predicted protein [Methanosarcina acetivorans C2A]|uniref:Uncharacterized protein n=1 Tax=Methanosarcina acetivorans (strain ATCC 35395 / DSM 2834 / JCM 12185 / C2A) TaxID=188937 RepID=Q8TJ33_METAC|nr:predicted protein [Methanosarcina acetivorans C2A]
MFGIKKMLYFNVLIPIGQGYSVPAFKMELVCQHFLQKVQPVNGVPDLLWLIQQLFTTCFFLNGRNPQEFGKIYAFIQKAVEQPASLYEIIRSPEVRLEGFFVFRSLLHLCSQYPGFNIVPGVQTISQILQGCSCLLDKIRNFKSPLLVIVSFSSGVKRN